MAHHTPKPGFTLAELLISLALLGIIAAFTIPKVLQGSAEQERVAKARETVATLEEAWYAARDGNAMVDGTLYNNIQGRINAVRISSADIFAAGELMDGVLHPSSGFSAIIGEGYYQMHNGVVVMGLHSAPYVTMMTPGTKPNTVICIDLNGPAQPNMIGQDVFFAAFNPWGDFDTQPADMTYTPGANRKSFQWGSQTESVLDYTGGLTLDMSYPQTHRLGILLAR